MTFVNVDDRGEAMVLLDAAFRAVRRLMGAHAPAELSAFLDQHKLRGSHLRLLSFVPPDGARVTDLAAQAFMTKQAIGEFVAVLRQAGLVEVVPDERDRRVRLVRTTAAGRRAQAGIDRTMAEVDRALAAGVGPERWATFLEVLGELARLPQDERVRR
jgi:DNA-binding MarR family transcriptional regulator